jgi:hypothetical protein
LPTDLQIRARLFALEYALANYHPKASPDAVADLESCARGEMELETCRDRARRRIAERMTSVDEEPLNDPDIAATLSL